jgi:hypothetical protein
MKFRRHLLCWICYTDLTSLPMVFF